VLHGLAEAMLFTALFTYAADCVPAARRTEGLALFGVSGMLPISLGALLGDWILARGDYALLFAAALGLAFLSLLLSLPLRDAPRGSGPGQASRGFLAALRQADLLPLWWIGAVFAVALTAVFTFLKRYVDETGLASVGAFFSAYSGVAILLRAFLGWLPDRVGAKRVLFPALLAMCAAFVLLALARDATDVVVAGLCFGLGHGFTFPILFGILVSRAGDADRGSAMAIFTALFDLGLVVGAPLFGAVLALWGFGATFGGAALALLAGSAIFALWDRNR
jgi:predicted MFS family arabinose efflux permease